MGEMQVPGASPAQMQPEVESPVPAGKASTSDKSLLAIMQVLASALHVHPAGSQAMRFKETFCSSFLLS